MTVPDDGLDHSFPTSAEGFAQARALYRDIPSDAVNGSVMVLITGKRNEMAKDIGVMWLILDPQDPRTGWLHSWLAHPDKATHRDRAADIERYNANMYVATRKLDFVHLVRLGSVIDYREQGRAFDEKIAKMQRDMHARQIGSQG